MTRDQLDVQEARLQSAIRVLRNNGCYLQAIARAYYTVYCIAAFAGELFEMRVANRHPGQTFYEGHFSHNETVDLVKALYDGQNSGNIEAGNAPGVTDPRLSPSEAAKRTNSLQKARKLADYGPTDVAEPFSRTEADEYLAWADDIARDLRRLLK